MKISELQSILSKASSLLGDAPIILHAIETDVETDIHGLLVTIESTDLSDGGTVSITHGPTVPAAGTPDAASSPSSPTVEAG